VIVPGKPFQPSLMFVGKARSLSTLEREHLKDASLEKTLVLPVNIRLG